MRPVSNFLIMQLSNSRVVKNCILLTNVVVGEGVHIEGQVVDKNARVVKMKEVIADPEHPGYIRRNDSV